MQRQLSVRWASTGVDWRRGLPNNQLRDPVGIPDFHPQIHLYNDAGKLSRLMVATRKYKEIYYMQANRRKTTWFNRHKLMVNNYALGILVLRSQHLVKILTLIASRSHTVTDPQPNEIHLDQPTKPNPFQVPTNHVRVHAAHDCEHGCYNSFTLCSGCTRYPWVMIILR
jgi:hypothetical protein